MHLNRTMPGIAESRFLLNTASYNLIDRNQQKIFHFRNLNAQSNVNKAEFLELQLLKYDPHATVITETWLNETITSHFVCPPSHTILRRDRSSRGGGVAVIVNP